MTTKKPDSEKISELGDLLQKARDTIHEYQELVRQLKDEICEKDRQIIHLAAAHDSDMYDLYRARSSIFYGFGERKYLPDPPLNNGEVIITKVT